MPPKQKSKSRAGSAPPKGFEQGLSLAAFSEENVWTASIALVVESRPDDGTYIAALSAAINSGARKLFSFISQDDLLSLVNEVSGGAKNQKKGGKDTGPQYSEICDSCKPYLEAGEELPLPLLAQLIKFRLLMIKDADQKRREAENKGNAAEKSGKGNKNAGTKSPGKGGKAATVASKKAGEQSSPKSESKLKKRGEADADSKFINDEPEDGPQHYIIMSGFYHPHLLTFLSEIGIAVDCVICVEGKSGDAALLKPAENVTNVATGAKAGAPVNTQDEISKLEQKSGELQKFWRDVLMIMDRAPETSSLHDVARLSYMANNSIRPVLPTDDVADSKIALGMAIFDDVANMMYNLSDARRQWKNYLTNVKLVNVPSIMALSPHLDIKQGSNSIMAGEGQSPPAPSHAPSSARVAESVAPSTALPPDNELQLSMSHATGDVDMRYYNELMNSVPLESTSVPLMLHCMLEQICATEECRPLPSETVVAPRADGLDNTLAQHLSNVVFKLALTPDQRTALYQEFNVPVHDPEPTHPKTMVINYNDDISRRLHHLSATKCLDAAAAELEMLGYTSLSDEVFNKMLKPTSVKCAIERRARLQKLLHHCSQHGLVNPTEVMYMLNQFIYESLELTSVDEEGNMTSDQKQPYPSSQLDVPWDDPYPYYVGMIPTCDPDDELLLTEGSKSSSTTNLSVAGTTVNKPDSKEDLRASLSRSGSILKTSNSATRRNVASDDDSVKKAADDDDCGGDYDAHSVHFEGDDNQQVASAAVGAVTTEADDGATEKQTPAQNTKDSSDADIVTFPEGMSLVNSKQKRNLDQWCFAEHMDTRVLIQTMLKAVETHSCVDLYRCRRDGSILVVMHNPYNEQTRHSHMDWHVQLHCNVRFRNYLEYVASSIVEWTQQEEAKYQAVLLAAEVEKLQQEENEATSPVPGDKQKGKKGDRAKSPPKKGGRASRSPSESPDRMSSFENNPLLRAGSIKAWKEEQERIKQEQELEEQLAEEKKLKSQGKKSPRSKSPQAKSPKPGDEPGKGDKQKDKKAKGNDKSSSETPTTEMPEPQDASLNEVERYWPFHGYDLGLNLVHASGIMSRMFPSDGGQICTERVQFMQGSNSVKASVLKDGHTFTVHVTDPQLYTGLIEQADNGCVQITADEHSAAGLNVVQSEPVVQDNEVNEAGMDFPVVKTSKPIVGRFGSFTAQLSDGTMLALSSYGPSGEPAGMKPYEPEPYVVPSPRSPSPVLGKDKQDGSSKKKIAEKEKEKDKQKDKGDKKSDAAKEKEAVQEDSKLDAVVESAPETQQQQQQQQQQQSSAQPFQQLFVSCPDGLAVTYYLDSCTGCDNSSAILVRQSYPLKTNGYQKCEASRQRAMSEISRVITSNGTVIKTLMDGSTEVLYADGKVQQMCTSSPILPATVTMVSEPVEDTSKITATLSTTSSKKSSKTGKSTIPENSSSSPLPKPVEPLSLPTAVSSAMENFYWITTNPSGERTAVRSSDYEEIAVCNSVVCIMSDPQTSQVMHTRDDKVVTVYYPDGTIVVEHADGTRITTVKRDTTVSNDPETIPPNPSIPKLVLVECLGFATVRFDGDTGLCTTEFGRSAAVIDCLPFDGGSYAVYPSSSGLTMENCGTKGCLRIDADGTSVYYPSRLQNSTSSEQMAEVATPYYIMRHIDEVIIETVDTNRCSYIVTRTGYSQIGMTADAVVVLGECASNRSDGSDSNKSPSVQASDQPVPQPAVSTTSDVGGGDGVEAVQPAEVKVGLTAGQSAQNVITYAEHAPRLFAISSDGTNGSQLLRQCDISEYLTAAEQDPRSIVLTERLPDCADVLSITVLREGPHNISDQWLRPYVHDSVIPIGLRSSCLPPPYQSVVERDITRQTHRFATKVGRGLDIGSLQATSTGCCLPSSTTAYSAPPVLEVRQILQYCPVTEERRTRLEASLHDYGVHVKQQFNNKQASQIDDPRSDDEKNNAAAVLSTVVQSQAPPPLERDLDQLYVKALTFGYVHTPPQTPQVPRKKADLEKAWQELEEEKNNRQALKEAKIPPYFQSDIYEFLSQKQVYDKGALANQVWGSTTCDGTQMKAVTSGKDDSKLDAGPDGSKLDQQEKSDLADQLHLSTNVPVENWSLDCPPIVINQATPLPPDSISQSPDVAADYQGQCSDEDRVQNCKESTQSWDCQKRERSVTSPLNVKADEPDKSVVVNDSLPNRSINANPRGFESFKDLDDDRSNGPHDAGMMASTDFVCSSPMKSTLPGLIPGQLRTSPVRLPPYLHATGRPGATSNSKFARVEEPVRRKINNTSVTAATAKGAEILTRLRGLSLLPTSVDFGVLKEGCTYSFCVLLKNTGIDACRFRVQQPPPSTGIKVVFSPGPVAAGLKTDLNIEIFAIAAGVEGNQGVGHIQHNLQITTETDNLVLPITATVLTAYEFEHRGPDSPWGHKAPGVRLVSTKPPPGIGVIRPQKNRSGDFSNSTTSTDFVAVN